MHLPNILAAAGLIALAAGHAGPHPEISKREITRRHDLSARCAPHVANFNSKRMKRNLSKRFPGPANATYQIQTEAPYYQTIQNDTCVLTPEVTQGPYIWPHSQTLRQDMTEDQPGIPLWLDVGVLDMETCAPLEGVLVDFWHCNATGSYSAFTGLSPNTPFEELLKQLNVSVSDMFSADLHTDNTTFLRGMWPTDKHGVMEMKTIFPGFYVERAIHIHVQVHTDWTIRGNGTIAYGNTISTGQIDRVTNAKDMFFDQSTENGYNPVVSVVPIDGKDVTKGMIGYITIGVDKNGPQTDS
ncbi:uncharacterized protein N7479_010842 [Penicillium vulpinum]|uniref:Intradiol ring-cleavage dioxygenases domain-containing protein n=1 Tax=Penicillium vulpinum TaxID=29845 RepID=A0A1V6RZW9_9EURO|nr:uncharacterized protein N7479_010842 [Penicillium vulpinum]KAJ5952429.1 hypothetical protein N7479_010842 [Penicillium vulpinum]OQE07305.1 hypothetical protein PENVUL_c014G05657 [Penicillium vulpinum]